MIQDRTAISANALAINIMILVNVVILRHAFIADKNWYWILTITLPLFLLSVLNARKKTLKKKTAREKSIHQFCKQNTISRNSH
jgi:hypothetical protein